MNHLMSIALSDNLIVNVTSIQFDLGTKRWYVRTFEHLGRGVIMGVGQGNDLNAAMTAVALDHIEKRAERLRRNG